MCQPPSGLSRPPTHTQAPAAPIKLGVLGEREGFVKDGVEFKVSHVFQPLRLIWTHAPYLQARQRGLCGWPCALPPAVSCMP